MSNIELRHTFPYLLPSRRLKNIVPGVILALLATPVLAAEQKQGNVLTLGEAWTSRHATRVRIKAGSRQLR